MTAAELIEKLQKVPPTTPIKVFLPSSLKKQDMATSYPVVVAAQLRNGGTVLLDIDKAAADYYSNIKNWRIL